MHIQAKNKATGEIVTMTVTGPQTKDTIKDFIESMPTAHGGTHPGFEFVKVLDGPEAPKTPDAT